jgi:hypothetical protein
MTKVVLISAKQGGGKTTLAKFLGNTLLEKVHQLTFASPLYEMHDQCLGVLKECGIERDIVKDGPLLQLLGTEWGRKTIDENIWVNILGNRIRTISNIDYIHQIESVIVVSDCRFRNEFTALPQALRVRLECNREVRKARCSAWRDKELHDSEVDLDPLVILGEFDLIFNTAVHTPEHCASVIKSHLDKNEWVNNRSAIGANGK